MAASRSMLEALLARVQKRAQEPRGQAVHIPPLPVPDVMEGHDGLDTLPPEGGANAAVHQPAPQPVSYAADDEEIEEYDEELIEIIDDADVIPQAAAAARAIEPSAFGASLERRGAAPNGKSSAPLPPAARAPTAPPHAAEPLRPEAVAARPAAAAAVVQTQGARRELRAAPFLELLDASLKLGS